MNTDDNESSQSSAPFILFVIILIIGIALLFFDLTFTIGVVLLSLFGIYILVAIGSIIIRGFLEKRNDTE